MSVNTNIAVQRRFNNATRTEDLQQNQKQQHGVLFYLSLSENNVKVDRRTRLLVSS